MSAPALLPDDAPHLLVVDDDRRIRDLLSRFLSNEGYRITTAETAADARAKLKGLSFDLIVLDVMMPGETGFEFAKSLREISTVPILMLTARDAAESRIKGLEMGADDYLSKPFAPGETVSRMALAGNGGAVSERAVDVQVNRLRRKIERNPADPLFVQTVRGIGYRLVITA
jgi:DNA-binding response OmpR family regulator